MDEIELKYKHALLQLGNCFDAIFSLSAKVEMMAQEIEQLKSAIADGQTSNTEDME